MQRRGFLSGVTSLVAAVTTGAQARPVTTVLPAPQVVGRPKQVSTTSVYAKGAIGDPGKSAYELAVDCGFRGTPEQWIRSLKGLT